MSARRPGLHPIQLFLLSPLRLCLLLPPPPNIQMVRSRTCTIIRIGFVWPPSPHCFSSVPFLPPIMLLASTTFFLQLFFLLESFMVLFFHHPPFWSKVEVWLLLLDQFSLPNTKIRSFSCVFKKKKLSSYTRYQVMQCIVFTT